MKGCDYMLKLNNMFYKIMGFLGLVIILANLAIPITGIIAGVLFISKNYNLLIFISLAIISIMYIFMVCKVLKTILMIILN